MRFREKDCGADFTQPIDSHTVDLAKPTLQAKSMCMYAISEILSGRNKSESGVRKVTIYQRDKKGKILYDEDGNPLKRYEKPKYISLLDYFSMDGLSDEEIILLVEKLIGVDLGKASGIKYISTLFSLAKGWEGEKTGKAFKGKSSEGIYKYIIRNAPKVVTNFKFEGKYDVIQFFRNTHKEGSVYRQSFCSFLKVMFTIHLMISDKRFEYMGEDFESFVNGMTAIQSYHHETAEDGTSKIGILTKTLANDERIEIPFTLEYREKSYENLVIKGIAKAEENLDEIWNDPLGMRYVVKNKTHALFILEFIFIKIFKKNIKKFEQKGFFDMVDDFPKSEEGESYFRDNLDPVFYQAIKNALKTKRVAKNNTNFKNVKIQGDKVMGQHGISYPFEVQVVLEGNKNEVGFADHRVYDGWKLLEVVDRLDGYITDNFLVRTVGHVTRKKFGPDILEHIKLISSTLRKCNYQWNKCEEELKKIKTWSNTESKTIFEFMKGVHRNYANKLVVLMDDVKMRRYKTLDRFEVLNEVGLLPPTITGARKIDDDGNTIETYTRIPDGQWSPQNIT